MPSVARRLFACAALAGIVLLASACAPNHETSGVRVSAMPPGAGADDAARPDNRPSLRPVPTVRVRITGTTGTRVVAMPLEQYVLGAVRAELPPKTLQEDAFNRVLYVQAIISRTYAVANVGRHAAEGFDLCDSTHCQLYRAAVAGEGPSDRAARAVTATRGEVVTYRGRAIQALFHSNCGGHTTSAGAVWGGPDEPYLKPVVDGFCARTSPGPWTFAVAERELRRVLDADQRMNVGDRLQRIEITSRDASGRAALVALVGTRTPLVRAEELRAVIRHAFGPRSMRSTLFTVTRRDGQFEFAGTGFGHGVGLCQVGATLRAKAGQAPEDIISHYFPGSAIQSIPSPRPASPRPSFGPNLH